MGAVSFRFGGFDPGRQERDRDRGDEYDRASIRAGGFASVALASVALYPGLEDPGKGFPKVMLEVLPSPHYEIRPVVIAPIDAPVAGNRSRIAVAAQAFSVLLLSRLPVKTGQYTIVHESVKRPTVVE